MPPHLWLLDQRPLDVRAVCNLVQQHGAAVAVLGGQDEVEERRLAGAQEACAHARVGELRGSGPMLCSTARMECRAAGAPVLLRAPRMRARL